MRQKKSLASLALELAAVLLVTILAFAWGVRVAQAERGFRPCLENKSCTN